MEKEEIIREEEFIVDRLFFNHPSGKSIYVDTKREPFILNPEETKFMNSNFEETTLHLKVIKVNNRISTRAIIKLSDKDSMNIREEYIIVFNEPLIFENDLILKKVVINDENFM